MMIEFVGSTGAGKTTLFSAVQRRLAQTTGVTTSFALVAAQLGLQGVTQPSLQNVIQECISFPFFMRSLPRHKLLVAFALRVLIRRATLPWLTINSLRSLVRKIGVDEIVRRNKCDQTVLIDEGMLLLAHNLFVYSQPDYTVDEVTADEVAKFAKIIPLPDAVVYVRAPVDSLINRALKRTDHRREIRAKDRVQLELYINRTVRLFEQLTSADGVRSRVLTVDNPESANQVSDHAVDTITEFVLRHRTSSHLDRARGRSAC